MTIAQNTVAKLSVAFVTVAMLLTMVAPAQAQTMEELQAQIAALMAQINALQSSTGSAAVSTSSVCPYTWTRTLNMGATGADVMKLQQFLNGSADTQVAATGAAGGPGMETSYYGPATGAAVAKFQEKYRMDILSPLGLVNATTFFGNSTMAKANALCATASTPVTPGDEDEDEDEDTDGPVTLGGEADLDTAELDSSSDEDVEEGSTDVEVAEFTVEFTDGDAEISRIDVSFDSGDASDAWDALETASLWVDGDMVAEMAADDEDDYQNDEMTLRFTGLDIVAMEDEELEIIIAVSTQNNIDADDRDTYTVKVESMRFFDADGVATTEEDPANPDTATFTIQEAGFEDELITKTSSNDPDSTTLQVEDNSKSDMYNVFTFDLDTDDSINDIELTTIGVDVTTGVANADAVIDDAELVIDGVTITDWEFTGASATTMGIVFDVDGDVTIDAGDRVEAQLMLRFNSANGVNYASGETISASADVAVFEAEGADDVTASGAATGDTHTLLTEGIDTDMTDSSAVATVVDGATNDYATFEIEVEITAFEQDVYIETDASDIDAAVMSSAGAVLAASPTILLESSANEVGGRFEITEGSTETITLQVTYVPGVANTSARLLLNSIGFYDASAAGTFTTQTTLPVSDYRTSNVTIVN